MDIIKKVDVRAVLISMGIWIALNTSDIYDTAFYDNGKNVMGIKVLHLIVLYSFVRVATYYVLNRNEKHIRHILLWGGIFGIVVSGIFFFVWPGTWSWDDVFIYTSALNYDLNSWQHFLSSIFHIISLQSIPLAGGVICVQILVAAILVGESVVRIAESLPVQGKNRLITEFLLFLPTVSLPVITYLYSGFRMGIYCYFELFYLACVYSAVKKHKKITFLNMVLLIFVTVIVASWRTEGIYYLLFLPVVLLIMRRRKQISVIYAIAVFVLSVVFVSKITYYNNSLIGDNDYSITATIVPLVATVSDENAEIREDELHDIGTVIDLDVIYQHSGYKAEEMFYMGLVKSGYSKDEYNKFMKAYAKIIVRNPAIAIKSMGNMFLQAAGVKIENGRTLQRTVITNTAGGALSLYDNTTAHSKAFLQMKIKGKYPLLGQEIREKAILCLSCTGKDGKVTPAYYICWNLMIPLCLLFACLLFSIWRRKGVLCLVMVSIFVRFVILFATSCAPYMMYYLSVYLLAYFWSIVSVVEHKVETL
nr:hypothetical protein [Lachnospiraceae bacterium]